MVRAYINEILHIFLIQIAQIHFKLKYFDVSPQGISKNNDGWLENIVECKLGVATALLSWLCYNDPHSSVSTSLVT